MILCIVLLSAWKQISPFLLKNIYKGIESRYEYDEYNTSESAIAWKDMWRCMYEWMPYICLLACVDQHNFQRIFLWLGKLVLNYRDCISFFLTIWQRKIKLNKKAEGIIKVTNSFPLNTEKPLPHLHSTLNTQPLAVCYSLASLKSFALSTNREDKTEFWI